MENIDSIAWPWNGQDTIHDEMEKVPNANLWRGKCVSCKDDPFVANVMIRKGADIKKVAYDMLKDFRHDTCIPHLNFYTESSNHGRLVLPEVQSSFGMWIKDSGKNYLFDKHGKMSSSFRTMIVDVCDLVEKLYSKKILIKSLEMKNLYLANEITPRILVLVTDVDSIRKEISMNSLWKPLQDVVETIYKRCSFEYIEDDEANRFLGFIRSEVFTLRALKRYPHNWNEQTKKEYMIALIAAQQSGEDGVRSLTRRAQLEWPSVNGKLPEVLSEIITEHGLLMRPVNYNISIPFDYLRLIRNVYKHFEKLPHRIEGVFGTKSGFIKKIEEWSPDIWKDLYDMIGWP